MHCRREIGLNSRAGSSNVRDLDGDVAHMIAVRFVGFMLGDAILVASTGTVHGFRKEVDITCWLRMAHGYSP